MGKCVMNNNVKDFVIVPNTLVSISKVVLSFSQLDNFDFLGSHT